MSKSAVKKKYYEIRGSQMLPLLELQYSLHKEITQIVLYTILNQKLDFDLLKQAVNIEIARNDSMRIRFQKHDGKRMQYFMPEYKLEHIPVLDFTGKTAEEQDAVLQKDARTPLKIRRGEMYRIILYRTHDGRTGIYLNICHVIADVYAVLLFFTDLLEIIGALQNKTPMPKPLASFEECMKKDLLVFDNEEEKEKHRDFFMDYYTKNGPSFYAGADGMRLLNRFRRKSKDPTRRFETVNTILIDKSKKYSKHLSRERAEPILAYCEKNGIPLQTVIYVGMRTYLSKINEETDDVNFMVAFDRRITLADKRSGGCRVNALPLRTVITRDKTFAQAIAITQEVQYLILRHTDYLWAIFLDREIKKIEHRPMFSGTSSMMFSCFPFSINLPEGWVCEMGNYSTGRFIMSLYTVVIPNFLEGGLDFQFEHLVKILYPEDLDALFEQSVGIIEAGIANPDVTIGELMRGAREVVAAGEPASAAR